jgi:uncharacterized phage protein (TIGR02218 family)
MWYQTDLTTLAFIWRIERRDGAALGFTSHDRNLVIDGLTYRAAPGMVPSAIERQDSLDPASVELAGALTSAAISEGDLAAGRWDGASLRLRLPIAGWPMRCSRICSWAISATVSLRSVLRWLPTKAMFRLGPY